MISVDAFHGPCFNVYSGPSMDKAMSMFNRICVEPQKSLPNRLRTPQARTIAITVQGMLLLLPCSTNPAALESGPHCLVQVLGADRGLSSLPRT